MLAVQCCFGLAKLAEGHFQNKGGITFSGLAELVVSGPLSYYPIHVFQFLFDKSNLRQREKIVM